MELSEEQQFKLIVEMTFVASMRRSKPIIPSIIFLTYKAWVLYTAGIFSLEQIGKYSFLLQWNTGTYFFPS